MKTRFIALTALACFLPQLSPAGTNAPLSFIFLNTGPDRAKVKEMPKEEVSKMQATHVGNFGTQFDRGTLIAAGPLGDNGFIRGTVLLAVQTPEQVAECFKPDPFVQNGILAVEAHPWLVDVMKFGTPKVPFQMARHTLCIVKKGTGWDPWPEESKRDWIPRLLLPLDEETRSGELAAWGPLGVGNDKLFLLLFYSTNQAQFQAKLETDPDIRDGHVQLEFHPQFLGKGTLPAPGDDLAPPKSRKRTPLFDGRTFAGWEGDTNNTWRIDHGALVGGSLGQTVPHNDFLCANREFKNFDLRLKVKLTGTGFVNGGIQFRSQRLKDPVYEMTGYQADMGEGYWASLYDESRRNKTLAHPYAAQLPHIVKQNDWNDYVVRCEDNHIRLWLNGVLTVDYTEDDKSIPLSGLIGLQIHGGGKAEASYKDITIEELL